MDFLIQNKVKQVAKNINATVNDTRNRQTNNDFIDPKDFWGSVANTSVSNTNDCNHISTAFVANVFPKLPQPIENIQQYYSYYIKESETNQHLPQDFEDFADLYEKQYTYYNQGAESIREVIFVNAIDADSSGTIGDNENDEYAKIVIRDLDENEITSFEVTDVEKAENFAAFGSIYLGKDQILCAFRIVSTATAGSKTANVTDDGMIIVKIDSKTDKVVFNSGLIETPFGEFNRIAETDYNNKTIGFINQQYTGFNSSNMMQSAWTYVDYNWETSEITSHTGPFTSAHKSEAPNLGFKMGLNDTSVGSSETIGAYHKDRGFGIRYKDWNSLHQAPGTILGSSANNAAQSLAVLSHTKAQMSYSYNSSQSNAMNNKKSHLSRLSANYNYVNGRERLWGPIGFNNFAITSGSLSNSSSSVVANGIISRYNCYPMTLTKKPFVPAHISKQIQVSAGNFSSTQTVGNAYMRSGSATRMISHNYFSVVVSRAAKYNEFISPLSQHMRAIVAKSRTSIHPTRIKDLRNQMQIFNSTKRGNYSLASWSSANGPLDNIPTINGLGLVNCVGYETFVNYKDTYIGTSIDED